MVTGAGVVIIGAFCVVTVTRTVASAVLGIGYPLSVARTEHCKV